MVKLWYVTLYSFIVIPFSYIKTNNLGYNCNLYTPGFFLINPVYQILSASYKHCTGINIPTTVRFSERVMAASRTDEAASILCIPRALIQRGFDYHQEEKI